MYFWICHYTTIWVCLCVCQKKYDTAWAFSRTRHLGPYDWQVTPGRWCRLRRKPACYCLATGPFQWWFPGCGIALPNKACLSSIINFQQEFENIPVYPGIWQLKNTLPGNPKSRKGSFSTTFRCLDVWFWGEHFTCKIMFLFQNWECLLPWAPWGEEAWSKFNNW